MTDLQEIAFDALREMYNEAEPPLDFDKVIENPDQFDQGWYKNHSLEMSRQREIIDKHCQHNNLSSKEKRSVIMTAILEYGPRSKMSNYTTPKYTEGDEVVVTETDNVHGVITNVQHLYGDWLYSVEHGGEIHYYSQKELTQ